MNTNKCPPDARSNNGIYSCLKISPNGNKCTRLEGHMDEHHAHGVGNRCMNVTGATKVDKERLIDKLEVDIFDLVNKFEKEILELKDIIERLSAFKDED